MNLNTPTHIKTIHLYNLPDGSCTFDIGIIPNSTHLPATHFFAQTHIEAYQKVAHPAPRKQFVVTLTGKLKFMVTNGDSFIIEPGILLIAEDIHGAGHTWVLLEGETWNRLYIPYPDGAATHFIKDTI